MLTVPSHTATHLRARRQSCSVDKAAALHPSSTLARSNATAATHSRARQHSCSSAIHSHARQLQLKVADLRLERSILSSLVCRVLNSFPRVHPILVALP